MKWRVAYQWGNRPGDYDRTFMDDVDATDVYGALFAATPKRPVNSRVMFVAMCDAGYECKPLSAKVALEACAFGLVCVGSGRGVDLISDVKEVAK